MRSSNLPFFNFVTSFEYATKAFILSCFICNFIEICFQNFVFQQDVQFARNYDKEPIVIITASHSSESGKLKATYLSVTAWIEVWLAMNIVS